LEEGEVVTGDLGVVKVGGFGETGAIIPLPACVVCDDGFFVGVDAFQPCEGGGWKGGEGEEKEEEEDWFAFGHGEE